MGIKESTETPLNSTFNFGSKTNTASNNFKLNELNEAIAFNPIESYSLGIKSPLSNLSIKGLGNILKNPGLFPLEPQLEDFEFEEDGQYNLLVHAGSKTVIVVESNPNKGNR